jgi:hypothetical protein
MTTFRSIAATLVLGLSALSASAQTIWNFGDASAPGSCSDTGYANSGNMGNTFGCTQQPSGTNVNLQVTAYGNTGTGGNFAAANVGYYGTGSGFGVRNATEGLNAASPQHSMDNDGQQDVLMLKFLGGPAALQQITLGWSQTDSDMSVLRWTGSGTPDAGATNITGKSVSTLLSSGWSLVSALSDVYAQSGNTANFNSAGLTSSYWLISAYNSAWGGTVTGSSFDYVKVLSVGATPAAGSVPEPTSIALVAMALFGGAAAMRRRRG